MTLAALTFPAPLVVGRGGFAIRFTGLLFLKGHMAGWSLGTPSRNRDAVVMAFREGLHEGSWYGGVTLRGDRLLPATVQIEISGLGNDAATYEVGFRWGDPSDLLPNLVADETAYSHEFRPGTIPGLGSSGTVSIAELVGALEGKGASQRQFAALSARVAMLESINAIQQAEIASLRVQLGLGNEAELIRQAIAKDLEDVTPVNSSASCSLLPGELPLELEASFGLEACLSVAQVGGTTQAMPWLCEGQV